MNVRQRSGPLGCWLNMQRLQYRLFDKGKPSHLNSDKREKLESIGFEFRNKLPYLSWDQRFQEVVDFKKVNGHANVSTNSGPLGTWISNQRRHYRLLKEGKDSKLTIDRLEKLESIGFTFIIMYHLKWPGPTCWYQWFQECFQELVNFKKINGHMFLKAADRLEHGSMLSECNTVYWKKEKHHHSPVTDTRNWKTNFIQLVLSQRIHLIGR